MLVLPQLRCHAAHILHAAWGERGWCFGNPEARRAQQHRDLTEICTPDSRVAGKCDWKDGAG
jgi:hypothetical protein